MILIIPLFFVVEKTFKRVTFDFRLGTAETLYEIVNIEIS